jgi:hypothetical protein
MRKITKYEYNDALTVFELIKFLSEFDPEMICLHTWESTISPMKKEGIYKGSDKFLLFDSDNNCYREEYEANIMEI